jgi:hypothetical protein
MYGLPRVKSNIVRSKFREMGWGRGILADLRLIASLDRIIARLPPT